MLVQILPTQVSDFWDMIKGNLFLPPQADYGPYDLNRIFAGMQAGLMQAWLVVGEADGRNKGLVLTTILNDISGVSSLMIYSVAFFENGPQSDWASGIETLKTFAKGNGCAKLCAFVMNKKVIELLNKYDVETRFTFAYLNL